jgi:hypothetical protein
MKTICRTTLLGASLVAAAMTAAVGCRSSANAAQDQTPGQIPAQNLDQGPDPAALNLAPVQGGTLQQAAYPQSQPQQQQPGATYQGPPPDQYGQQGAPIERRAPSADANGQGYDPSADQDYDAGQAALEEADQPPPPLPQYDQPEAPEPDYLWTPGYWSWGPEGYYWVPGGWCAPPYEGALWTPGYWYFYGNRYRFHGGYWGPYVGFYGGINYGFGYSGIGYVGGFWNGPHFFYNRAVTHVNVNRITNVYNRTVVINNINVTRVSYNGGRGGLQVRPRPAELVAARVPHTPPMSTQLQVQHEAAQNRSQLYSQNKGQPAMAAAARPITADRGIQRPVNPIQDTRRAPAQALQPNRPAPQGNPQAQPAIRPSQGSPEVRQQPQPEARQPQPEARPAQAPARQPEVRPAPQQQQPQGRPQPDARPAPPQAPVRPQSEIRPIPQQQPHLSPQPQARPAPQQQPVRPQPEARPAPQPQPQIRQPDARPQQQAPVQPHPQAQPQPHPQPQARPAAPPPPNHPREEEKPR